MSHDFSQPVPQGSDRTQDAENSRIAAIANELERLCAIHEAQCGDSLQNVNRFETEQRAAEQMANLACIWICQLLRMHGVRCALRKTEDITFTGYVLIWWSERSSLNIVMKTNVSRPLTTI